MDTQKIIEAIEPLAQKLEQSAEFMYEVYRQQVVLEGWISLLSSPIWIFLIVIFNFFLIRNCKKIKDWVRMVDMPPEPAAFFTVLYWLLTFFFVAAVCRIGLNGLLQLLNPDYYVIQEIISSVNMRKK